MNQESSNLIDRIRRGDETSFDDIVQWYSGDVLRLCYLMLWNREEAMDMLQETLIRFVDRVKSEKFYERNGSIKSFLLTCARNLCIDKLRQRRAFMTSLEDVSPAYNELVERRHPARHTDERRFQEAFLCALSQLTDVQRTVLVLFDVKGDSHREIAQSLSVSIAKVKTELHRARMKLRHILEPFAELGND